LVYSMSEASKSHGAASLTRIRDNQRRSRAKRKELLESLQQRIQDYERRGVVATIEVQQAAKAVAHENAALRHLLARHGVSPDEINQELQAATGEAVIIGSDTRKPNPVLRPQTPSAMTNHTSTATSRCDDTCEQTRNSCEAIDPHPAENPTSAEANASNATRLRPLSFENLTSAAETSCIAAATIIAQMRGDGDDDFARTMLLGCHGTTDCKVKNTTLFQVLDEV
jgi:hypothetical protein